MLLCVDFESTLLYNVLMREITWIDEDGYKRRSLIRDDDPNELAPQGIPVDPPDLSRLDWLEIQRDLHNILVDRGLSTWEDVRSANGGVTSSIVSVMKRRVIALYRTDE